MSPEDTYLEYCTPNGTQFVGRLTTGLKAGPFKLALRARTQHFLRLHQLFSHVTQHDLPEDFVLTVTTDNWSGELRHSLHGIQ